MFGESCNSKKEKSLLLIEIMRLFYNFLNHQLKVSYSSIKKIDDYNFIDQLKLIKSTGATILYIDFQNLLFFSEELADIIEDQFTRVESSLKKTIREFFKTIFPSKFSLTEVQMVQFRIGFYNLPNTKSFNFTQNCCYGKLICTIGKIVRIVEPEPRMILAVFECSGNKCKQKIKINQNFNEFSEPKICPNCKSSDLWEILIEESIFIEIQRIRIQEFSGKYFEKNPDTLLDALLIGDATNLLDLGAKCVFTGCTVPISVKNLNSVQKYLNFGVSNQTFSFNLVTGSIFSSILLVNHVFCLGERFDFLNIQKDYSLSSKTIPFFYKKKKETILRLKGWSFFSKKINSVLFQGIKKYENFNFGILLFLAGGVDKKISRNQFFRGNINLSLVHSPNFVFRNLFLKLKNINPEIIYANALTSSIVGLTGLLTRDFETNSLCIDSGLFTNKNKDIYFIENFHYLDDRTSRQITNCMEKQELRINKAEIKLVMKSRISILAISELPYNEIVDSRLFLKSEISRKYLNKKFDLNFIFGNEKNFENEFLAWKTTIYPRKKIEMKKINHDVSWIQLYLVYAKNLSPIIPTKSYSFLLKVYLFLRKIHFNAKTIDYKMASRQLETLIRLSEAFGKLLLSPRIQEFHIKAAARILFNAFCFNVQKSSEIFRDKNSQKKFKSSFLSQKLEKEIAIKFSHFDFMVKKIILILGKKNKKVFGISVANLIKTFFFYFSNINEKKIGLTQIKKVIKTLKNLTYTKKRLLVIKLSKNSNNIDNCFLLDKF